MTDKTMKGHVAVVTGGGLGHEMALRFGRDGTAGFCRIAG